MIYARQIVQYNDLVFDASDIISTSGYTSSFKGFDSEYGFTHGSYSPHKTDYVLSAATTLSFTATFHLRRLPCEVRPFFKQFVITQLTKYGKVWAVENGTLEWAFAELRGKNEVYTRRKDVLMYDIDLFLPEGVWHKADKLKTFLVPYDPCTFMDCYDYHEIDPCHIGDCCHCGADTPAYCHCCECGEITEDMALCFQAERGCCKNGLENFYSCDVNYRIVYNCAKAYRLFDDLGTVYVGQRFCTDTVAVNEEIPMLQGCGPIVGVLYSDTEIPTTGVKIRLHGDFTNPSIDINGNVNYIEGTYTDLIINEDGSIYEGEDCNTTVLVSKLIVPTGMEPGWTIYPGKNRLIIDGVCGAACAYIEVDALTV